MRRKPLFPRKCGLWNPTLDLLSQTCFSAFMTSLFFDCPDRQVSLDRRRLIAELKSLRATLVEPWRSQLLTEKLALIQTSNRTALENLARIQSRIAEMEDQGDAVVIATRATTDFSDLLPRPASEIYVALAEQQEKLLEAQIDKARLERVKASSMEKVVSSL